MRLGNGYKKRRYHSYDNIVKKVKESLYQKPNIERKVSSENEIEVMNPRARAVSVALQRGLRNSKELAEEESKLNIWLRKEGVSE